MTSFIAKRAVSQLGPIIISLSAVLTGVFLALVTPAQEPSPAGGQPPSGADDMAAMMAMAQPGKNHQLLAALVGTWDYKLKFWMVPGGPAVESKGISTRKPMLDGHYFTVDSAGKMQMPGANGKVTDVDFKGMAIEGYDNVKQKFVSTWIDNMGTSIILAEGTYDTATKTLTYHYEQELMPGIKTNVRQTIRVIDQDHHLYEWFEMRGGAEVKTMELACTRQH